jgi:DSF synthase
MLNNNYNSATQFYDQLVTEFNEETGVMWCYANPNPRPCFTTQLLEDLKKFLHAIKNKTTSDLRLGVTPSIKYLILGSYKPGVFSLGGDLDLFVRSIRERDRKCLHDYMKLSIDVLFGTYTNMDVPLTTIALIRGNALGAGFEGALSCDYLVAEKSVQLGFPEVLFNMFPGMGAYSFLSRRISPAQVERMILSGRIYSADELYDMGVVDVLANDGEGLDETNKFVIKHARSKNTRESLLKIRHRINPVCYEELIDIGKIWVDAAMSLTSRELKVMERLIKSQDRMAKTLVQTTTVLCENNG